MRAFLQICFVESGNDLDCLPETGLVQIESIRGSEELDVGSLVGSMRQELFCQSRQLLGDLELREIKVIEGSHALELPLLLDCRSTPRLDGVSKYETVPELLAQDSGAEEVERQRPMRRRIGRTLLYEPGPRDILDLVFYDPVIVEVHRDAVTAFC